jgi:phosphoribosyl 1,2-cyclic phosphate phosphodiesterase
LGTAAAEGFPAVFCNCDFCKEARRLKGKNIRTRSQSLVNDDLLIDLPADTFHHFLENDIEGDKIKFLLITHSHQDHCYPDELSMRHGAFAHNMRAENLEVFCGEGAFKKLKDFYAPNVRINLLKAFETIKFGDYEVIPLPAKHYEGDNAFFYIIKGDKTILYAHDTGYFYEEVFEFIKENGFSFDMISLDCTNVDIPSGSEGTHMDFEHVLLATKRMEEIGAVTDKTIKYINHFSHNANPLHHTLEERVKTSDFKVSYDGCKVEI